MSWLKLLERVANVIGACLLVLMLATLYATERTRQRTACYNTGARDCGHPDYVERFARFAVDVITLRRGP